MTPRALSIALAAVALLAAVVRLGHLAAAPLGPAEMDHAWAATQAATRGIVSADGVTNPAAAAAQAVAFAFVEANAFLARLPAALAGLALALVPLALWRALGPTRALALAVLVAIDPALVLASRDSAGPALALLAAALAAAGLVRWGQDGRTDAARGRAWSLLACASAGAMAACGPDAWTLAPLVGLAALAYRPWAVCAPRARACVTAGALGALLPATAGLWAIPWAAGISAGLTAWLEGIARPAGTSAWLAFVPMHPLTILLALVGLARTRSLRMGAALVWAALLATRGDGSTVALAAVLAVAAATGAGWLVDAMGRERWLGLAAAGLALVAQLGLSSRSVVAGPEVGSLPGLDSLASDLERVAVARGREAHELPVVVLGDRLDPDVAWALRGWRSLRFATHRPEPVEGALPALVVRASEPPGPPPARYVGTTYASSRGKVNLWVPLEP